MGINFIDSADVYTGGRSEETIGRALGGGQNSRREKFIIATKFRHPTGEGTNNRGASRLHMFRAVEASLRRLNMSEIDLLYVHSYDDTTPIEETLRALDDLVRAGKLRYAGASNFMAWQIARANLLAEVHGWSPLVVIQSHYHMFERGVENELLPYCASQGVGLIPYFPLAGGFLTGKYRRGQSAPPGSRGENNPYVQSYMTDANYSKIEALQSWAEIRGHSLGDLAHAWLLAHPQVCSVISGATRADHVEANARGAGWVLTNDEMNEVSEILKAPPAGDK